MTPDLRLDIQLCDACSQTYVNGALPTWNTGDVHVFLTRTALAWIIAFKGSVSLQDWFDDFKALPRASTTDPAIGDVHTGFLDDVSEIYHDLSGEVQEHLGDAKLYVTGHSKGGAEAQVCAALLLSEGFRVDCLTTFGAPRVGGLGRILEALDSPSMGSDYRYGMDPVPEVPIWMPHPRQVSHIGPLKTSAPPFGDPLRDHHIRTYWDTLRAM